MEKLTTESSDHHRLNEDDEDDFHCQELVWRPILAFVDSMVLKCAVKLRLFDAIHRHAGDLPISLPELAASLPLSPDRLSVLRRLLRYLAHLRLLNLHHGDSCTLTTASSVYLREASEKSQAAYVKFLLEEDMFAELHLLDTCLSGGEDVAGRGGRGDIFERAAGDSAVNKRFNDGMVCTVRPIIEAVLEGWPEVFEGVSVLVDVGGGVGVAAAAVGRAFPSMRCIVFDLPHVVEEAPKSDGVEYEAGDLFVSVPRGDALLLVRIFRDYNDEKALQILSRCREAIAEENGKLIIIDGVMNETDSKGLRHVKLAFDILMMAFLDGKQRTEKEWRSLLLKAAFTRCNIIRVNALMHLIEARP
ncbi:hypothetical protein KSP39_PZI009850 [Platanthera zijinensis]|uniref:Uncharacterized protein n=1 Tax=Platanthera zijinensis TaxID=2320716 RepID=A0AAP0G6Y9_9ASPA